MNNHDQKRNSINEGKFIMKNNDYGQNLNKENNNSLTQSEKRTKTQSRMDTQSLVDMCTKKLEIDPFHKKALLLRASSFIKNQEFDRVK